VLDIRTVGAGGGSIAVVDEGGVLQVGPASAGADPGPICYSRGGTAPTVTDADLVLGYLGADDFLGGKFRLDLAAAENGIADKIAGPLAIDRLHAAEGIHRLVNTTMADAIRLVSIGAGHDPRQCVLVVAGGAGAVHAAAIAAELGISHLLIPRNASVFCAAGMLLSDLKHDYVRTLSGELGQISPEKIHALYREMAEEAIETLSQEGVRKEDIELSYGVDLKYVGQFHEVTIPFAAPGESFTDLKKAFDAQHRRLFSYNLPDQPAEALHWRLTAVGRTERPSSEKRATHSSRSVESKRRQVVFAGVKIEAQVFEGAGLAPSMTVHGPAIVEEPTTTVVIPPKWELSVNNFGDYEMSFDDGAVNAAPKT
jgi:N-methylhydantoinase A